MTKASKKNIPPVEIPLDPGVKAIMDNPIYGAMLQDEQTPKGKLKKKALDRARIKGTFDIPRNILSEIEQLSVKHSTPKSQIVTLLLLAGLKLVAEGNVNISQYKRPTKSPRFDWVLEMPKVYQDEKKRGK
jgi:hypothetical protein